MIIQLEANIAAGKSTLAAALSKKRGCTLVEEHISPEFLALFYSDPATYGFAFQSYMLSVRMRDLTGIGHHAVIDRGLMGDYVFARNSKRLGTISTREFEVYKALLNRRSLCRQPDVIVYLHRTPAACLASAQGRSREAEAGVGLDYLSSLDTAHFDTLMQWAMGELAVLGPCPPIVIQPWEHFGTADGVMASVNDLEGEGGARDLVRIGAATATTIRSAGGLDRAVIGDISIHWDMEHTPAYRELVMRCLIAKHMVTFVV